MSKTNPGKTPDKRKLQLDAVLIQLTSQRPSDIWRGMEQIQQWLKTDKDDREVYGVLLEAVQKNPDLRDQVRNIFSEMMQQKSEVAERALIQLPTFIPDILTEADDAYYAAEYGKAIQLYQQVLRLKPDNVRAKDHLEKAVTKRDAGETTTGLPRPAQQFYLRARSYLAANEIVTALNLLSAAIEAAEAKGMRYPEAEETMINVQKLLMAEEHISKAKTALENGQRKQAIANYKTALNLHPSNPDIRRQIRKQQFILNAWWEIPVILLVIGALGFYGYSNLQAAPPPITVSTMPSITITEPGSVITPESTVTNTDIATTVTAANTDTPLSPTPTETLAPLATPTEKIVGNGYINKAIASAWLEPNKKKVATLTENQALIVLEEKFVSGSTWYRCRWETDGTPVEGWILAEYVTFGTPPTPRP